MSSLEKELRNAKIAAAAKRMNVDPGLVFGLRDAVDKLHPFVAEKTADIFQEISSVGMRLPEDELLNFVAALDANVKLMRATAEATIAAKKQDIPVQ